LKDDEMMLARVEVAKTESFHIRDKISWIGNRFGLQKFGITECATFLISVFLIFIYDLQRVHFAIGFPAKASQN
jgi:hypothetical protein